MQEIFQCFNIDLCRKAFSYLEAEYGFLFIESIFEEYEAQIVYKSHKSGIVITYHPYDLGIMVDIAELFENEIVPLRTPLCKDTKTYTFNLFVLLEVRNPSLLAEIKSINHAAWFSQDEFEKIIMLYAKALKENATDFLSGDLAVLLELEKIYNDKAQRANMLAGKDGDLSGTIYASNKENRNWFKKIFKKQ